MEAKFRCPYCGKKIKTIPSLKAHIFEKHLLNNIYCPFCNESFWSFLSFQHHLLANSDDYHQNLFYLLTKRHIRFVDKKLFLDN